MEIASDVPTVCEVLPRRWALNAFERRCGLLFVLGGRESVRFGWLGRACG